MLEPQTDQVPWTIQQTFLGVIYTLVPWIAFALFLNGLSVKSTATPHALSFRTDLTNAIIVFLFSSLIEAAFLLAPLFFANRSYRGIPSRARLAWQALGFRTFSFGKALILIIILMLAILTADNVYQVAITYFHLHLQTNDQLILQQSKYAPLSTYATLLVAVFVAPFCEEVFFRGFVFGGLRQGMHVGWAIVLSSLIFAVAHADVGSFAVLFLIGLALAFIRWRTASLWPGMLLHIANNALGALFIILTMQGVLKA